MRNSMRPRGLALVALALAACADPTAPAAPATAPRASAAGYGYHDYTFAGSTIPKEWTATPAWATLFVSNGALWVNSLSGAGGMRWREPHPMVRLVGFRLRVTGQAGTTVTIQPLVGEPLVGETPVGMPYDVTIPWGASNGVADVALLGLPPFETLRLTSLRSFGVVRVGADH